MHVYSGIPNKAFYLAAHKIGGGSWEKCGQLWTKALFESECDDNFAIFAGRTIRQAKILYDESIENIVQKAWFDVGVNPRRS